ncbi:MAG: hypothetical protein ACLSHU_11705 [Oscillospiraceae bacterium]
MTDVEMARQAVGRWKATAEALARDIWSYAELPYCETKSAAALCGALEREGFSVETHGGRYPHLLYRRVPQRNRNAGGGTAGGV